MFHSKILTCVWNAAYIYKEFLFDLCLIFKDETEYKVLIMVNVLM